MRNVIISDAGPIFSLAVIGQLNLLEELFDEIYIPQAVWEEITALKDSQFYPLITGFFKDKVRRIEGKIDELKPLFQQLIGNNRYYSLRLLNAILVQSGETTLELD